MKIVNIDNFNRDEVSDTLVCSEVSEYWGTEIVEFLNDKFSGDKSALFFELVEDDCELYVAEP